MIYIERIKVNAVQKYTMLTGINGILTFLLYKKTANRVLLIHCFFNFHSIGYNIYGGHQMIIPAIIVKIHDFTHDNFHKYFLVDF
jgi:hypothetical protein